MTDIYWDETIETMPVEQLRQLQLEKLKASVARAANAPFYRDLGLKDYRIESLDDLSKLPVTTKQDLRDSYPYRLVACPLDEVVRLHSSSGTTGTPTVVYHSKADIDNWTELTARCMFTGGMGFHYAGEHLGCLTLPTGPGNTSRQLKFLKDFDVSVIHVIPSYALHLADTLEKMSIDPRKYLPKLRIAFLGAEPHTEETRQKIQDFFGIKAFNSFGLSEMNGPGVAFECPHQNGLHIWDETLKPVPEGQQGELVITTLNRTAMPLIRYRTKDLTHVVAGQCSCGRTHRRIARMQGRSDDMLILKGVNIFPMQIEQVLVGTPGVGRNYQIILEAKGHNDHMIVRVELDPAMFAGDLASLEKLKTKLTHALRDEILITPDVELCEPGGIPVAEGKAVRVVDNRPR
ncbi:MAG: Phenylacetate-coenzyme A ligase [Deltaproteobacteria bacterium ADurb.Bin510]|nr:MAG: Phenylacetate-coenzyme A ligase [Deltaproteobacteria bacterium ADurb.Bin510]